MSNTSPSVIVIEHHGNDVQTTFNVPTQHRIVEVRVNGKAVTWRSVEPYEAIIDPAPALGARVEIEADRLISLAESSGARGAWATLTPMAETLPPTRG